MNAIKRIFPYLLFIILIIPTIVPLFKPYVSGTADGIGHRFRLVSFYNSLKEGDLKPRWAGEAALGYGAPTFLFNYPLPYYAASFFHKLGFSINQSGQILAASALLLSGIFMFLAVRRLIEGVEGSGGIEGLEGSGRWGGLGGLVAAVVYTYAPYHLQMTYLYDAWGEELAFVFPPVILYLMVSFCHSDSLAKPRVEESRSLSAIFLAFARDPSTSLGMTLPCHFALLTIAWVFFILSHNVSALMFTPVLILLGILMASNSFTIGGVMVSLRSACHPRGVLTAFVLAILLSSFFWLPALVLQNEMKYPQFLASEGAMRGSFFKSFSFQLETAVRVIKEGTTHYLDFTVGLPILLIGLIGLISLIRSKRKFMVHSSWFIVLLLFSLYLTNYASNWLWNLPIVSFPLSFILYPFRFLFVASFTGAILSGLVISKYHATVRGIYLENVVSWVIAVVFILITMIQGLPYTKPYIDIFPFPDSYFSGKQTVTSAPLTRKNMLIKEFLPKSASLSFLEMEEKKSSREEIEIVEGKGKVDNIKSTAERLEVKLDLESDAVIRINKFYFPNWRGELNGRKVPLNFDKEGRIIFHLPSGRHDLWLTFGIAWIERFANIISLLSIFILVGEVVILYRWGIGTRQNT